MSHTQIVKEAEFQGGLAKVSSNEYYSCFYSKKIPYYESPILQKITLNNGEVLVGTVEDIFGDGKHVRIKRDGA